MLAATAAPPSGSRVTSRMVSSPATVPMTCGQHGVVDRRGEVLRRAGRRAQDDDVGASCRRGDEQVLAAAAQPARRGRLAARRRGVGRRPRPARRRPGRRRRSRTLTAPSSSRSRDSVAWVTSKPSAASSSASSRLRADRGAARGARRCAGAGRPWCGAATVMAGAPCAAAASSEPRRARRGTTSASSAVSTRGGASRTTSAATALTRKPRSRQRRLDLRGDRRGERRRRAAGRGPRTSGHERVRRVAVDAGRAAARRPCVACASRSSDSMRVEHGERGRARRPGCRRRSSRGCRGRAARRRRRTRRRPRWGARRRAPWPA